MKFVLTILLIYPFLALSQPDSRSLVIGNVSNLCLTENSLEVTDSLPSKLDSFDIIFFFSNSISNLSSNDIDLIESFILNGGGLYTGSDNWPLQAEANQITREFYQKESFGNYETELAQASERGNLKLEEIDSVPAGKTTSAFPMDYRLTVEAWVDDQPLILSGKYGDGKIIIDTGYSRFYCEERNESSDALFEKIVHFLLSD